MEIENKATIQQVLHSASLDSDRKTSVEVYRGKCGAGQTRWGRGNPPLWAESSPSSTKIIASSKCYFTVLFWTWSSYNICDLSGAFACIWSSQNFMLLLSSTWFVKYLMLRAILQKTLLFLRFFIFIWNKCSTHKEECSHNLLPLCTVQWELLVYTIPDPTVTGYSNINSVTF